MKRIGNTHHQSEVQRSKNAARGHFLQGAARRDPRTYPIVAGGAMLLVKSCAILRQKRATPNQKRKAIYATSLQESHGTASATLSADRLVAKPTTAYS